MPSKTELLSFPLIDSTFFYFHYWTRSGIYMIIPEKVLPAEKVRDMQYREQAAIAVVFYRMCGSREQWGGGTFLHWRNRKLCVFHTRKFKKFIKFSLLYSNF